jgi:hypothetical protein
MAGDAGAPSRADKIDATLWSGAARARCVLISSPASVMREEGVVVMTQPATELRRLVGKFALLFAFIYLLFLMTGVFRAIRGPSLPVEGWPLFLIPGGAFVPAVVNAVRLHRTSDSDRLKTMWPRCAAYTVAGMVLIVAGTIAIGKIGLTS